MKTETAQHTPAPWVVFEQRNGAVHVGTEHSSKECGSHFVIADIMPLRMEKDANARLIAAAPDIYQALKDLSSVAVQCEHFRRNEPYHHLIEQARHAIGKAGAK